MKVKLLVTQSCPTLCNPRTVALQVPLSMGFSRQERCPWDFPGKKRRKRSGLPFPPPGDLPHPGIKPGCPAFQADSLPYVYIWRNHILLNQSSICEHLGCFNVLAIVNSVTVNIRVHVSFSISIFIFSRYMPRNRIAGSYGTLFVFF